MARREPRPQDTRERILDAALEVFGEHGFHQATVDEIAARAGLTKGAVYYWFADKEDLGRDLQHRLWAELGDEAMHELDPEGGTIAALRLGFAALVRSLQRRPAARAFLRDAWFVQELDAAGKRDQVSALGLLRAQLEVGVEKGELVDLDVDALTRVLMGAFVEATLQILETGDAEPTVAVVHRLIDGLAAPRPRRRTRSA